MAEGLMTLATGTRVSRRWIILKKLGAGSYGAVYLCQDEQGTTAALKTEPLNARHPLLVIEATVLLHLNEVRASDGLHFCRCLDLGRDEQLNPNTGYTTTFNYVVMTLVGRPLDKLIRDAGDRFSPGTAIGLSIQLLNAIQGLHKIGFLHRDIKPGNATIGLPETSEQRLLYLIDFGMARRYIRDDGQQRPPRATAHFRGTPIYAPISAHIKRDYSRKDDIESWFYVMVKFYKGALPWKRAGGREEFGAMKCLRMGDKPEEVRRQAIAELIGGCPAEFGLILAHIDSLTQEDRPDYETIEMLLRAYLINNNIQEHPYDWEVGRRNSTDEEQAQRTL